MRLDSTLKNFSGRPNEELSSAQPPLRDRLFFLGYLIDTYK